MKADFEAWVDELLAKTDIAAVISRYVPLKQKGDNWWGCCPFHHEKEPSFAVNISKQFYHCFGCKESGNAITFIQKMESVDRIDAIRILAAEAHMEMPRPEYSGSEGVSREKKDRLLGLLHAAARHYYENLSAPKAEPARAYLNRRGVDESLVKKFGLGYSLDSKEMISFLLAKGYTHQEMKDAGIAAQGSDGYYDVYYSRLIFPIINNFGEVVAFGGRTLEKDPDFAKYRNTSQTAVFDKSKTVYAINLLKKRKQRAPINYIIMTEGYMDVIALHKAGFDTAVASMGTALTWPQAKQLRNYCERIYISYDGDAAGQKATMRGLDILAQAGLSVRVVRLPDGLDPDDVIRQKGREFYAQLISEAETLPQFKINALRKNHDISDPEGKSKFAIEAIKVIKALENPVEREEYINLVRDITGYNKDVLLAQADITVAEPKQYESPQRASKPDNESVAESADPRKIFILASLAYGKSYVDYNEDLQFLIENECEREVYEFAIERVRTGENRAPGSLFSVVPEKYSDELSEILAYEFLDGDGYDKYVACIVALKLGQIDKEKRKLAADYSEEKDIAVKKELAIRIAGLDAEKAKLKAQGR